MRYYYIILIGVVTLITSCKLTSPTTESSVNYQRHVGDILYNPLVDSSGFKVCNDDSLVYQYFNLGDGFPYTKGKDYIIRFFNHNYSPIRLKNQNGKIRIRFIVNCNGKTGRFRILESDENYQPFSFNQEITNQLLSLTKSLNDWKVIKNRDDKPIDYYMYLTFIIKKGELKDILP